VELEYDLNTSLFRRKPPGHRGEPHDVPRLLPSEDVVLSSSSVIDGAKPAKMARRSSGAGQGSGLNGIKWEMPCSGRRSSHGRSPTVAARGGALMSNGPPSARKLSQKPLMADDGTEPPPRKPRRRCRAFPTH
jgi:hypothetical protein